MINSNRRSASKEKKEVKGQKNTLSPCIKQPKTPTNQETSNKENPNNEKL